MKMMQNGIRFEQRRILLANVRFSDSSEFKKRPVVIISNETFNNEGRDVVCCPITANIKEKHGISINSKNLEEGQLYKLSRIKSKYPFFLEKNEINKEIGKIDIKTAKQIITDIKELISLN
jgi:mRNA-degrading endonuclease toxin of MazEF toxin-antitoxin module